MVKLLLDRSLKGVVFLDILVERAVLVGVNVQTDDHFEYSMEELGNLAEAIDVEVVRHCRAKYGKCKSFSLCWDGKNR